MMAANHRLPGVYFEVAQQPVTDNLPRMDIVGFIGFTEKGPVNIPVTIEDVKHFRDIFGSIVPLAWDNGEKRYQHSQLAVAVEQFFRNGGRRCRVVRVAQEPDEEHDVIGAQRQMFVLPNLLLVDEYDLDAVLVTARAVGSWADQLRVSTRLQVYALRINNELNTEYAFSASTDSYNLFVQSTPSDLQPHDLIEVRFSDTGLRVYIFIDDLDDYEGGKRITAQIALWFQEYDASPPEETAIVERLTQSDGLLAYQSLMSGSPLPDLIVRRLRMDLLVWEGDSFTGQIQDLGFHSSHPRFWGKLPDDELLFAELMQEETGNPRFDLQAVIPEAIEPRFPLSVYPTDEQDRITVYLPLGMQTQISKTDSRGAVGDKITPEYIRNGLESFSADLFLDPHMAGSNSFTLQTEAFHRRYILGERLKGIHALLADPAVSLLSVPDIGHRQWDNTPSPFELPMSAPLLLSLDQPDKYDRRTLHWTQVAGVRRYIIQTSTNAQFDVFKEYTVERPDRLALQDDVWMDDVAETYFPLLFPPECSKPYFFRVRAEGYGRVSPWSNTLFARLPERTFYDCTVQSAEMFTLQLDVFVHSPAAEGQVLLSWQLTGDGYTPGAFTGIFELELAYDMEFASGRIIYRGPLTEFFHERQFDELAFFRVRAVLNGSVGPWSNTEIVTPELLSRQTVKGISDYDDSDLLAVQCAIIRLCASDADKVAILSLPRHYLAEQVTRHVDRLLPSIGNTPQNLPSAVFGSGHIHVPPLNQGEARSVSFAALFHPWLYVNATESFSGEQVTQLSVAGPADGAVCGQMAATSNQRGAWIASANKPLVDSIGLVSHFKEITQGDLLAKQINIIGTYIGERVVMHWDTLSRDSDFRSLSVRRFMNLLLRLARREGSEHVFESNGNQLRDAVQAFWEQMLSALYQRGALRGRNADEAFRVVTGDEVNNQQSEALGRFYVELRVAPSRPMNFIIVRLTQTDTEQLLIQEL